jgi:uncharacterized protein YkwD
MRNLRSNQHNIPDFDRFGFRPLVSPGTIPTGEKRQHRNSSLSRPTSSSIPSRSASQHVTRHQDNSDFVQEALQRHNALRQRHGVEPLRLNNDLSKLAQKWGK